MSISCSYLHGNNEISCNGSAFCKMISKDKVLCDEGEFHLPEGPLTSRDTMFWVYLGAYVGLVLFAGLMSGLTMGLLSLDILSLKVLSRGGKPNEQKHAAKIIPLVTQHHLLLVTLLLANAVAVESMPLCLDRISNPIIAVVVSVTAVLIFGEVLPQALCTRFGLAIGAFFSPFVKVLMFLLFIIAYPISKLLDCLLGEDHSTFFRRAELKELVSLHLDQAEENEDPLSPDEVLIIKGALDMRNKTVADAYTPLARVFMLDIDEKMTEANLKQVVERGHSRIPLFQHSRENIVGLLMAKTLIPINPDDCTPVKDVCRMKQNLLTVFTNDPLFNLLNKFQTGKSHIGIVKELVDLEDCKLMEKTLGIITLEDIIEELIQEDIYDESDLHRLQTKVQSRVNKMFKNGPPTYSRQRSVQSARDPAGSFVSTDESKPLLDRSVSFDVGHSAP